MNDTFLTKIDTGKIEELLNQTSLNVTYFNNTCSAVVSKYTSSLDNLMSDLYIQCIKSEDATTETLEKYYLELSNLVYFMNDKLEELGVYADMSKSAAKEVYSKAYLNNQIKDTDKKNKTTVAECQAVAELAAQYDTVVGSIYEHAYKVVKNKIESAKDMMNTLRKILTVRAVDMQLDLYKK